MNELVAAKLNQAVELLREFDLPMWIVQFARETYDHPQPVQELMVGTTVTWPAAFVVEATGRKTAIVGTGDLANVNDVGAFDNVVGYVRDIGPELLRLLESSDPARIGLSFSADDDSADNLSHGMYLVLRDILAGSPFEERLVSADDLLIALRARKTRLEVDRICRAIDSTLFLFGEIERMLQPGVTERQVVEGVHGVIRFLGLTTAWDSHYDPVVNFGSGSKFGHAGPGDIELEPGMLVHVDLGVKRDGYCSDLQRMWYLLREDEAAAPDHVMRPFRTVVDAMRAGFETLRPGIPGWKVDEAARGLITEAGYDAPQFALGHQLGQTTHDGGGLLGPRWPRYRRRPDMLVEAGNVFTLEFALQSEAGIIGLEEDVLVGESGAEYLTPPQTELVCLRR